MMKQVLLLAVAGMIAAPVQAEGISATQMEVMKSLTAKYASKAKADAAKAKDKSVKVEAFSAETGRQLYLKSRNWEGEEAPSCSACHTEDPKQQGTHASTKKPIKPLAPVANAERFTDAAKVEKNFAKHCQEIYTRDCDASEKGNFLTYMMSVK
jgi:mono/diheme cytochrome c family protein